MQHAFFGFLALVILIVLLSALAPARVAYTEEIVINAPVGDVYDDIRLQEYLMRWSAWPKDTKSTCAVEGPDGQLGVKTAFFRKGKRAGYQEVVSLK